MAFWNREELPPELQDKKPADIAAALRAAEMLKTEAQTAKDEAARVATELASKSTEIDGMKARMAELEANQKPPVEPVVEDPPSPWVDPEKFVADQTKGTQSMALMAGLMAAKTYFMQNLSQRDLKIFKKYEKEVEGVVGTFAPQARVMPQSWLNALLYVKGMHEQDIAKAEASSNDFFSEPASRGAHQEPEPEDKLTAEEEEICRSMHWDPKNYLERKKLGQIHSSSKGAYARFPAQTTR